MATAATKAVGSKLLKKLTIKTFIGDKSDVLAYAMLGRDGKAPTGEAVPLMRVLGSVTKYQTGSSDFGDWVKLFGSFHATNLQTGEVLDDVSQCLLPSMISDSVAGALNAGATSVEFAVEIDARFVLKAATMYEFEARTLIKPAAAKPINELMAKLQALGVGMTEVKALAAPKLTDADKKAQAESEAAAEATRPKPAATKEKASAK